VSVEARTARCDRARGWAALAPDGELADLERRLLAAHLRQCAPCGSFARHVADVAAELRAAAPSRPGRRFAMPEACVRRSALARARAVAAVAAVAALALGTGVRPQLPADAVERPSARSGARDAADAAAQTIRQLQREALLSSALYPDRPASAFGDQPA
jgi:hypothetical protein